MTIVKDNTKRNKRFEKICRMTQKELKEYLRNALIIRGREVIEDTGFIYSKGNFPVLICAHMDTVHKELPSEIIYDKGKISSPQGIGGDDRCGIYMCMEILREIDCHVAFFEDEEIGGVGSDKFCRTEIARNIDVNYIIELDRSGENDAVFYSQYNPQFENFITETYWKTQYGTFTDICNICPEIGVAGVNLSCGYYRQHTKNEYVVLKEMKRNIKEVINLIKRGDNTVYYYDEIIIDKKYDTYNWYSGDVNWDLTIEFEVQYVDFEGRICTDYAYGATESEAFMSFMMDHGDLCFNNILYFVRT